MTGGGGRLKRRRLKIDTVQTQAMPASVVIASNAGIRKRAVAIGVDWGLGKVVVWPTVFGEQAGLEAEKLAKSTLSMVARKHGLGPAIDLHVIMTQEALKDAVSVVDPHAEAEADGEAEAEADGESGS